MSGLNDRSISCEYVANQHSRPVTGSRVLLAQSEASRRYADVAGPMTSTTFQTAKNAAIGAIGLGAVLALITATVGPSGWLWTGLRALNAAVFVVALVVWLIGRPRDAEG
jgi:hypothetical protein